jgi:hypothetical protein
VEWLHLLDAESVLQLAEAKLLPAVEWHQPEEEPLAPVVAQLVGEELALLQQRVPNQQSQLSNHLRNSKVSSGNDF